MKPSLLALALSLVLLTSCSTANHQSKNLVGPKTSSDPETVLITYRVKPGSEAEFEKVLAQAWKIYRQHQLVFPKPHLIVRDKDSGDKTRFVEVFTWVSHAAPDHAPEAVKKIWEKMMSLCEKRDGHGGLEGGEVQIMPLSN